VSLRSIFRVVMSATISA